MLPARMLITVTAYLGCSAGRDVVSVGRGPNPVDANAQQISPTAFAGDAAGVKAPGDASPNTASSRPTQGDTAAIRQGMRRVWPRVHHCLERRSPIVVERVTLEFDVQANGTAAGLQVRVAPQSDRALERCIGEAMQRFSVAPPSRAPMHVTYPFFIDSAGD